MVHFYVDEYESRKEAKLMMRYRVRMERETEGIGEDMVQGEPRDVPAEASGMPLSFLFPLSYWLGRLGGCCSCGRNR